MFAKLHENEARLVSAFLDATTSCGWYPVGWPQCLDSLHGDRSPILKAGSPGHSDESRGVQEPYLSK